MSKFNDFLNIFDENITVGKIIEIGNISLIPLLKVNVNFLQLDKKEETKDNTNANVNATPFCLIKVVNEDVSLISLEEKSDVLGKVPQLFEVITKTIDISSIFKPSQV